MKKDLVEEGRKMIGGAHLYQAGMPGARSAWRRTAAYLQRLATLPLCCAAALLPRRHLPFLGGRKAGGDAYIAPRIRASACAGAYGCTLTCLPTLAPRLVAWRGDRRGGDDGGACAATLAYACYLRCLCALRLCLPASQRHSRRIRTGRNKAPGTSTIVKHRRST